VVLGRALTIHGRYEPHTNSSKTSDQHAPQTSLHQMHGADAVAIKNSLRVWLPALRILTLHIVLHSWWQLHLPANVQSLEPLAFYLHNRCVLKLKGTLTCLLDASLVAENCMFKGLVHCVVHSGSQCGHVFIEKSPVGLVCLHATKIRNDFGGRPRGPKIPG
jgi:hypothetical protein